jgi:hypothetical protein
MRMLTLAFLMLLVSPPANKPNPASGQAAGNGNGISNPSINVFCGPDAGKEKEEAEDKTPARNASSGINWEAAATWALVGVGLLTFWAVWKQANETTRATQAMRDSLPHQAAAAKAALLNAQAVINAERPWVVVEGEIIEPETIKITARIKGRTPAKIRSGWGQFEITPNTDFLGETFLKDEPVYALDGTEVLHELLAIPDEKPIGQIYLLPIYSRIKPNFALWKRLTDYEECLFVYGRVIYTDILSKDETGNPVEHETRWCFKYLPQGESVGHLFRSGKRAYNGYT